MKINKMLIAVLAMLAVVLSSCKDDDPTVGIDSGMPAPAIYYDAQASTGTNIGVYWNAQQAASAGATSFTVQLIKTKDGSSDVYDNTVSQTLNVYDSSGQLTEFATFTGLTEGRIFYVRIRANYPRSVFSEWVLAAVDEANPNTPARIKVGTGIVDDDEEETSSLKTKIVAVSESTAVVSWSTCNWTNNNTDAGFAYNIELFKDAECKNLEVSWALAANSIKLSTYGTSFIFSGLTPETSYYFRVTNTTDNIVSDPLEIKTNESKFKDLPATANPGDIILYQDFHEFLWGGDLLNNAAGYSNDARSSATSIEKATGVNPVSADKFYLASADTEMGLFNTLGKAIPNTSLKDWGQQSESGNADKPGILLARPGMLKMGASNYRGAIVTPELKCLTQPATIEVTFKTAAYDDNQNVIVELLDGTTKSDSYSWITATSQSTIQTVNAGSKGGGWTEHTVTISNVTSTSRIAIGSADKGEGSAQHRFYLDDIQIKLISYGELSAPDAPVKPELTATDRAITVKWEKVARADGYKVEYKESSAADWTASEKTNELTYTIEGLKFETAYDVRVVALLGELASEPSEVAQITTLAEIKKLDTPTEITATPGLGWVWLKFAPVTNATDYEVYAGDTKVESKIMSEEGAATTVVCAYGLNLNAAFALKVKAVADGIESSDLSAEVTGTTGNIRQLTNNVSPRHVSVNWDDVSGGTSAGSRAYYVELSKDQSMANPIYALYCQDGQASANGAFGSSSWYGKADNKNLVPPTSVTFGQLEPSTTYYFRVKTVANVTTNAFYGTVTLNATNGASEFSPVIALTTEAPHSASANEVLFQGFDDLAMQSDFVNIAAGATPYVGKDADAKAAVTIPHTGEWCMYPFANSHLFSTWGMATDGAYIDGEATHNEYTNRIGNEKSGSLNGWYIGDQVSPHQGYVKIGTSSKSGYYLATPALDSPLLSASGTNCTFSFKGCLLMTDNNPIDIEVYRAATKNFETIKTITLESCLNSGWTTTDYVAEYKWTTYSVDLTLYPGDNVAIVTKSKNRLAVDDILIVTK